MHPDWLEGPMASEGGFCRSIKGLILAKVVLVCSNASAHKQDFVLKKKEEAGMYLELTLANQRNRDT